MHERSATLWFLVAFAASRVAFAWAGLAFSTEHVARIMHFPDLELLRDRLLETVWHLHGQPPLPSLVLGLAQKVAGDHWPLLLAGLFHLLAAWLGLAMLRALCRLGVRPASALGASWLFTMLPAVVVYEHYAFTTLPVAALLVGSCSALANVGSGRLRAAVSFLLLTALLLWVRNVFHLAFWVASWLLLLRTWPGSRRAMLVASLLPALFAIAPYAKNAAVHGRFETSSWVGFGLARKTWHQEDLATRQAEALRGERARIEAVPLFAAVEDYALAVPMPAPTGVPVLDEPRKRNGEVNYHHAIVASASAAMRDSAVDHIARFPGRYLANVFATVRQFFAPSTSWAPLATPRAQLGGYGTWLDALLHTPWLGPCNTWALFCCVVLLASLGSVWRVLRQGASTVAADRVVAFAALAFVYVAGLAVLLDTVEVMRHRLKVDALLWLVAGLRWLPKATPSKPLQPGTFA
ncbi:MAG: hypothetical protein U1F60_15330 [Planctomycetota bacterium]